MKRVLFALAFACALTACSTALRTPAQAVFALEATYDAALDVAIAYASLPRCASNGPVLCSDPATVRRANDAARQAWTAIRAAQAVARAAKPDATTLADTKAAAEAALATFTTLTAQMKVS